MPVFVVKAGFYLAGGALAWAGLKEINGTIDKVNTLTKWAIVGGVLYVAGKQVKAW